jgi:hypothetical protein
MYLLPNVLPPVYLFGLAEKVKITTWPVHVNPVWAAWVMVAPYVHVAKARDAVVVQALYHLGCVEAHEHVVMPRALVGMHKEGRVGEVIVVIDDVAEVDLGLALAKTSLGNVNRLSHTIASRPLFFGTLFSALALSTSYTTTDASGISLPIHSRSSLVVLGTTILNV